MYASVNLMLLAAYYFGVTHV